MDGWINTRNPPRDAPETSPPVGTGTPVGTVLYDEVSLVVQTKRRRNGFGRAAAVVLASISREFAAARSHFSFNSTRHSATAWLCLTAPVPGRTGPEDKESGVRPDQTKPDPVSPCHVGASSGPTRDAVPGRDKRLPRLRRSPSPSPLCHRQRAFRYCEVDSFNTAALAFRCQPNKPCSPATLALASAMHNYCIAPQHPQLISRQTGLALILITETQAV